MAGDGRSRSSRELVCPSFLPPSSSSSRLVRSPSAVAQSIRDDLVRPVHDLDELAGQASVLLGHEEGDGGPLLSRASGTADAVDVRVHVVGEVEVHDHPYVVDVEAAGGDVGGTEEGGVAALELAEDPVALGRAKRVERRGFALAGD